MRVALDPETGLSALPGQENAVEEVFLEGTGPTDIASPEPLEDPPPTDWPSLLRPF